MECMPACFAEACALPAPHLCLPLLPLPATTPRSLLYVPCEERFLFSLLQSLSLPTPPSIYVSLLLFLRPLLLLVPQPLPPPLPLIQCLSLLFTPLTPSRCDVFSLRSSSFLSLPAFLTFALFPPSSPSPFDQSSSLAKTEIIKALETAPVACETKNVRGPVLIADAELLQSPQSAGRWRKDGGGW
eukprot:6185317-Pleurochrysis_carterae.AAC.1